MQTSVCQRSFATFNQIVHCSGGTNLKICWLSENFLAQAGFQAHARRPQSLYVLCIR
jgi:hypothetical protein